MLRKDLRKKARKARREFDARVGALPKGKTVQRPIVKKLWINGKASEDRDEWMEEMRSTAKVVMTTRMRRRRCRKRGFRNNEDGWTKSLTCF